MSETHTDWCFDADGLKPRELSMFSEALQNEHATFLDRAIRDNEATANILSHGTLPPQGPLSQIYDTGVLGPGVVPMTGECSSFLRRHLLIVRKHIFRLQCNMHASRTILIDPIFMN